MTTLASYDDLPYESVPIPDTHPAYLGALAHLFGLAAAPADACRVLELGCAGGGNLVPMAWHHPNSRFVGIDLGRAHIDFAQSWISELGLGNVEVLHRSVTDDLGDLGEFDYILAHGLFSWVPEPVQDAVLALCARHLTADGIAYISYNTLPGWHARAGLREMLLAHVTAEAPAPARLAEAYAFFDFLEPTLRARDDAEAKALCAEIEYLRQAPPSYVYHEYLEETNAPLWFGDFMARARAVGLDYLAEADLASMLPETLGETAEVVLADEPDRIRREQRMDCARLRKFRRTLLVRQGRAGPARPDGNAFLQLAFHAELACAEEVDLGNAAAQDFHLPGGGRYRIMHPLAKAAALLLGARYPDSLGWVDLSAEAAALWQRYAGRSAGAADFAALRDELFSLVAHQAVRVTREPRALAMAELPARPAAHALARSQARQGTVVASLRHSAVDLDLYGARLLAALDGSRDLDQLTDELTRSLREAGQTPPERAALFAALEALLWTLARAGLLMPAMHA